MRIYAIIPARGNSKGVKNKNLYKINNKPLIHYTLNTLVKNKNIDEIFVSSESDKILTYAKKFSRVGIIKRPLNLSKDHTHPSKIVHHFISFLKKNRKLNLNDLIFYLQPTSPLRNNKDINVSIELMKNNKIYKILSVRKSPSVIYKSLLINNNKIKTIFDKQFLNFRRQDFPETYIINGAIFAFSVKEFLKNNSFPNNGSLAYIMPDKRSLDIDNIDDIKKLKKIYE